jgi:hypothetical protein
MPSRLPKLRPPESEYSEVEYPTGVLLTFAGSFLIMKESAWVKVWDSRYSCWAEFLYMIVAANHIEMRCKAEIAKIMRHALRFEDRRRMKSWLDKALEEAVAKNHVKLQTTEGLGSKVWSSERGNDGRMIYPIPTPAFLRKWNDWAHLVTDVHLRTLRLAVEKSGGVLPRGRALSKDVEYDFEEFLRYEYLRRARRGRHD